MAKLIIELDTATDSGIIEKLQGILSNGLTPSKAPAKKVAPVEADDAPPEEKPRTKVKRESAAAKKKRLKAEAEAEAAAKADDDLLGGEPEPVTVTMDDLRKALSPKLDDHREAIRKYITDAGAEKLGEIPSSEWPKALKFLESLD